MTAPRGRQEQHMADEIDGADEEGTEQGEMFPNGTLEGEGKSLKMLEQLQALAPESLTVA